MTPHSFTIIAHRGASGLEPENTCRAFRRAVQLGCQWVECDVRMTRDGKPVILHDATVNRTTNGRGRVSRIMYQVLRKLDAGEGEKIPTLKETLLFAKRYRIRLVLEIKDPKAVSKVVSNIQTLKRLNHVIVSSFSASVARRAKKLNPALKTALIIADPARDWVKAARRVHADMVHILAPLATKGKIRAAHDAGFAVWAWTLDTQKHAQAMHSRGADGIFTNYPERFARYLT